MSQWDCLLKNLGEWQGSFTRISPMGEILEDTPTMVSLEGHNNNKTIRQVVRSYQPDGQPPVDRVFEYSSLSKSVLFFENGAFSQGSLQWGPYSEFGAELGLIEENRRLRVAIVYNTSSQLDRLTLIREKQAGSNAPEKPHLTIDNLLGEWIGEAVTLYPDWRNPDKYTTRLRIESQGNNQILQTLSFGARTITSTARLQGNILYFDQGKNPVQILLLPDGASCNCPVSIKTGNYFFLEIGWLVQPSQRQRMIRTYDNKGGWESLTLVKEEKIS